jgi:hypothetical protein
VALGGTSIAAVSLSKNSVGAKQIKKNAVKASEIARNAVGASEIRSNAVAGGDVADGSIGSLDIGDNAIGSSELADDSVFSGELGADSVGNSEMGDNAVGSPEIADGSVGQSDLAPGTTTFPAITVQYEIAPAGLAVNTSASYDVTCPAGQQAIGGGSRGDTTDSEYTRTTSSRPLRSGGGFPTDGQNFIGWRATVVNRGSPGGAFPASPPDGPIQPEVWAICAPAPAP